jgi:hypothetical protein
MIARTHSNKTVIKEAVSKIPLKGVISFLEGLASDAQKLQDDDEPQSGQI